MALNSSGPLSMGGSTVGQSINLELGVSATALASINSASFRTLAGVSSGQISISNFYGKSNALPYMVLTINGVGSESNTGKISLVGGFIYAATATNTTRNIAVVSKINQSTGAVVWSKQFSSPTGSGNMTYFTSVTNSSGETYFFSAVYGGATYILVKFDTNGNVIFCNTYAVSGGYYYFARDIVVDNATGNLYALGYTSPNSYGSPAYGIPIKFNSSGVIQWNGFTSSDAFTSIDYDAVNNNVLVGGPAAVWRLNATTGAANGKVDVALDGSVSVGAKTDSSGNLYLWGGAVVAKYNSSLAFQWAKKVSGGSGSYSAPVPTLLSGGSVFVSGINNQAVYPTYSTTFNSSGTQTSVTNQTTPSYDGTPFYAVSGTDGSSIAFMARVAIAKQSGNNNYFDDLGYIIGSIPGDGTGTGVYLMNGTNYMYYGGGFASTWSAHTPSSITVNSWTSATNTFTTTARTVTPTNYTLPISVVNGSVSATTGSASFTFAGTYTWIAPTGVTSVSAVCIGGGAGGRSGQGTSVGGGGGGATAYANNMSVTPGSSYTVVVGAGGPGGINGSTYSGGGGGGSQFTANGGVYVGSTGASGGTTAGGSGGYTYGSGVTVGGGAGGSGGSANSGGGGGGGGGYTGTGGTGGNSINGSAGAGGGGGGGPTGFAYSCGYATDGLPGGGTGLGGLGPNGAGGTQGASRAGFPGSYGRRGWFGAGGSAGNYYRQVYCCPCYGPYSSWIYGTGGPGISGGVRIIWPGNTRSFPSTNAGTP